MRSPWSLYFKNYTQLNFKANNQLYLIKKITGILTNYMFKNGLFWNIEACIYSGKEYVKLTYTFKGYQRRENKEGC